MEWPSYSSDMKPIDHVWVILGTRGADRLPSPQTLLELDRALLEQWDRTPQLPFNIIIIVSKVFNVSDLPVKR